MTLLNHKNITPKTSFTPNIYRILHQIMKILHQTQKNSHQSFKTLH